MSSHGAKKCCGFIKRCLCYTLIGVAYGQRGDRCLDEIRIQSIDRSHSRPHVVPESSQRRDSPAPVGPPRCSDIENVSWRDMRPTIMNLLRYNFSDGLDIDVFTPNLPSRRRRLRQRRADDEVDLSYSIKCQFEKMCSIALIVGRHDLELEVVQFLDPDKTVAGDPREKCRCLRSGDGRSGASSPSRHRRTIYL